METFVVIFQLWLPGSEKYWYYTQCAFDMSTVGAMLSAHERLKKDVTWPYRLTGWYIQNVTDIEFTFEDQLAEMSVTQPHQDYAI